jgi:hypothetical protein
MKADLARLGGGMIAVVVVLGPTPGPGKFVMISFYFAALH